MPELGDYTVTIYLRVKEEVGDALKKASKGMEEARSSADKLSSTLKSFGTVVAGVVTGLIGFNILREIGNWVKRSIDAFADFEAASVKLASVSARAGENVRLLAAYFRVEASAAAREFGVSGQEAISALESLVKAGLEGADAAKALGGAIMLAKLEGIDFQTAANNLVQVMAQFGIAGSEATRVVDALVNASRLGIGSANDFAQGLANCGATAKGLGLSLEDAAAWLVILERRFGSAQEAGTHLNRFFMNLHDIAGKLGVSIRDVNGNLRSANEIILDVVAAARELGGDFQILQERLTGVDSRAIRALLTFTQMTENFPALAEAIRKAGVAMKAFEEYMNTARGQMAQTEAEMDRQQRRLGAFFTNLWIQAQKVLLPAAESVAVAWSGIAATITGDAIPALESWLESQRMMGRLSDEVIADMIAGWAEAGEVILSNGKVVKITLEDAAKMAEHLGVKSEKLTAVLTNTAKQVEEYFTALREQGQLTRDAVEGTLMALVMDGKLTSEQAIQLAEKFGFLDEQMRKSIEMMADFGKETANAGKVMNITGDAVEALAKAFDIEAEKVRDVINKTLGLNIEYDKHAKMVEEVMEKYGLSREQAEQLVSALEAEAEAAKKAKEAEEEHRKALEEHEKAVQKARDTLQSSIRALLDYGAVYGPMADNINKARDAIDELTRLGERVPARLRSFLSFAEELNDRFAGLERSSKAVSAAQSVAAVGASYYSSIVSIQEGLIADQIVQLESQIQKLKEQEEALRASGDAAKQQIESIRQQRAELELQLQSLRNSVSLTEEQIASQIRLDGIQKALGLTTQILSLQQTALQLALLGATDASDSLMNVSLLLADALSDGTITSDEYKKILEALGITFDETGKPVINLKSIMEEFRDSVIKNMEKVKSFREELMALDGLTAHTYHYHHEITVKGEKVEERRREEEKTVWGAPWPMPAQYGMWNVPRNMPVYLHRGEMVLPRNVAEWFRRGGAITAPNKILNVSVHVNAQSASDPRELAEIVSREIVRRLRGVGM